MSSARMATQTKRSTNDSPSRLPNNRDKGQRLDGRRDNCSNEIRGSKGQPKIPYSFRRHPEAAEVGDRCGRYPWLGGLFCLSFTIKLNRVARSVTRTGGMLKPQRLEARKSATT